MFWNGAIRKSYQRLSSTEVNYIELHGNNYSKDLGYKAKDVKTLNERYAIKVSGICGMFSP